VCLRGLCLGPALLLLYINDIDFVVCGDTVIQLFADDAKLFRNVIVDGVSLSLQQSLDRLVDWTKEWQLSINIQKCAVLSLSTKPQYLLHDYFINGIAIPRHTSHVDLDIAINNNLFFEHHISNIVSKARQRMSIFSVDSSHVILAPCVKPLSLITILEYNSIVWNPTYIHLIDLVENVQRNFSKRIPSLSCLPYTERLALLDLDLLELHRLRFDLIYYFKVLHNLTLFEPSNVFIIYYSSERSRSELSYLQKTC
jgi:hypothetical protein